MDDTTETPDGVDLGRPNVIPIGGYSYPPPPEWTTRAEVSHQTNLAGRVLGPEDLTLQGQVRCTARNQAGVRCGNKVVKGSHVCRFHGAGGVPRHEDDLVTADGRTNGAGKARTERIEAIRLHLELTAASAVMAVQSVLEDEMAKPSDRLKAAEIVLDRTVGRHLQLEREDLEERDLDEEIFALTESLHLTGTDDVKS